MSKSASTTHPQSTARNKLRFHGSISELKDLILPTDDYGEWEEKPNGIWRYRSEDGGGLNWSSTRGTVWFDGRPAPCARLQRTVEAALRNSAKA